MTFQQYQEAARQQAQAECDGLRQQLQNLQLDSDRLAQALDWLIAATAKAIAPHASQTIELHDARSAAQDALVAYRARRH